MTGALLLLVLAGGVQAAEVAAVLSSEQRAQREIFAGFTTAFGKSVDILPLGAATPASAKVVLALGGKAALQRYPARVSVVYAAAPGLSVDRRTHDCPSVMVMMEPEAAALLAALKSVQPGLKRLAVLWTSAGHSASVKRLVVEGAARGVAVSAERLEDPEDLPSRLRALKGTADAMWLPPDPLLLNAKTFEVIKHFSYDNDVPFYVPTEGLAALGATGAVAVSYQEMGRLAAEAVKAALAGGSSPVEVQSDRVRLTLNSAAAAAAAHSFPPEALKTAEKVFP